MTPETKRYLILLGAAIVAALARVVPSFFPHAPEIGTGLSQALHDIGMVMLGVPFASPGQAVVKAPPTVEIVSPVPLASAPEGER